MNYLKELNRISKSTEKTHGVKSPNNSYQITKTGISKLSGKETLSVPVLLDIFIWIDNEIIPSTPFAYFKTIGKLEGSTYEFWVANITKLLEKQNAKKGYDIVNHGNMRTKYLGIDWNKICDELNGKYVSSNPYTAITNELFNSEEFEQTTFNRKVNLI